eukprot:3801716-Rhodomonas_salina.1
MVHVYSEINTSHPKSSTAGTNLRRNQTQSSAISHGLAAYPKRIEPVPSFSIRFCIDPHSRYKSHAVRWCMLLPRPILTPPYAPTSSLGTTVSVDSDSHVPVLTLAYDATSRRPRTG